MHTIGTKLRGSSDAGTDTELQVRAESIESDEELRLHLLGMSSFFSQLVA